ncbi:MAG TPA: FadR/GntR family transcriptional regulator [Candidatus Limnocylindrales bacterium]
MRKANSATVQDRIVDLIHERRLAPGAALPTEPQLVDLLGASRNSVREAIRALQALGIVEIRHGFGTFVGKASLEVMRPSLHFRIRTGSISGSITGLRDLIEVREVLEVGLIARVADSTSKAKLSALDALVNAMMHDLEADRAFHALLYESLGNELVLQLIDLFWQVYHEVEQMLGEPQARNEEIAANHRRIVEALRDQNPHAAQEAMRRHFRDVKARIAKVVVE